MLVIANSQPGGEAFNLVCSGTLTERTLLTEDVSLYEVIYRVDLQQGKWCEGDCTGTRDIYEAQPTFLTLDASPGYLTSSYNRIDRQTGEHMAGETVRSGRDTLSQSLRGHCELATFTGFPKLQTKF